MGTWIRKLGLHIYNLPGTLKQGKEIVALIKVTENLEIYEIICKDDSSTVRQQHAGADFWVSS